MTVRTREGTTDPARAHKPGEIIGKLREVEIVLGQGGTTAEACRRIAVIEQTPAFAGAGSPIAGARNMVA